MAYYTQYSQAVYRQVLSQLCERASHMDVTAEVWVPRTGVKIFDMDDSEVFCVAIYDGDYSEPSFESADNDILEVGFNNVRIVRPA